MQEPLLVLASGSPRRKELLGSLGLSFDIQVSEVDETLEPGANPVAIVQDLAYRKAMAVANTLSHGLVLGADTIVVNAGEILGKPVDEEHARRTLASLSGHAHTVYTGIALVDVASKRVVRDVCETQVVMKQLSTEQIAAYVATGEPMDKAGAYAIQGKAAQFVTEIHGDYYNVVGLPISRVADHLAVFGIDVLPRAESR